MNTSLKFMCLVALLFTLTLSAVYAQDVNNGEKGIAVAGKSGFVVGFSWDVFFAPDVTDEEGELAKYTEALSAFTTMIDQTFLKQLGQQIPNWSPLIRRDNGASTRCELIEKNLMRGLTIFSAEPNSNSYNSYVEFTRLTNPSSLSGLLKDIPPIEVNGVIRPWTNVVSSSFFYPNTCFNGVRDGEESDVDCGYDSGCNLCWVGQKCQVDDDCIEYSKCVAENEAEPNKKTCSALALSTPERNIESSRVASSAVSTSIILSIVVGVLAFIF